MNCCYNCGKEISSDAVGLNRKLINRGIKKYMCLACMAEYFCVSEAILQEKILQFKELGCALFGALKRGE